MVIPVDINENGRPGLVCANYGFNYSSVGFGAGFGSGTTVSALRMTVSGTFLPAAR